MKYQQGTRRSAKDYEQALVTYWKDNKTFEKSVSQRPAENSYVFYDGPPFITGVPHHGTLLSSIVKDAIPRYWTMKGMRVERRWGWDCHGLPAEVFTERKLGIQDKREIGTKISLEDYIVTCRQNMVQTGNLWEDTIDRIGRWVNFQGAYRTMDKPYMESVWWAFKTLYEKGKIYEGEKVLMYCVRDATPISKAEVAMDNSYQDVTDPSVYVKFRLINNDNTVEFKTSNTSFTVNHPDTYLLAWTTTPWTLPSNTAVAVNNDVVYAEIELDGQHLILAEALLSTALTDEKHTTLPFKLLRTFPGSALVGMRYEPLFDTYDDLGDKAFKVWHADFVHANDGTGIAHESPAYGEEDYALSRQNDIPWVLNTDENGIYTDGPWQGRQIWEVNKEIAKTLHEQGIVWKIDYIRHSYPHCHRCGTKLMYRAHPSWFLDIDGQRQEMLAQNGHINWFPDHIKQGRFAKTVESAPDWNLSRDRFWATAMPVWKATDKHGKEHVKVVGSYAELKELSGVELDDYHRPWIDAVTFEIDGLTYTRIDKVLDCWFESGSMPFAQFHYPFENVDKFEQNFPGDFIAEYVGQVRAWFYYLHAVSTALFGKNAFSNVIVTGTLLGTDGRKLSKSLNNFTDPNILMDQYSADSLRFLLLSSPALAGEDFVVSDKDVADIARKLNMIWNMFDFFTLYANVDGWEWDGKIQDPSLELTNPLDQWIVSRLHQVIRSVDEHMSRYDIPNAMKPILEFLDDASNWYVRRSRKRFWKSEDDSDKSDAYKTLHYVLVQVSIVLAPFAPFLAEELYQKMTGGESVHLLDWPREGHINELIIQRMAELRQLITLGLSLRAENGIKVRQPLANLSINKDYEVSMPQALIEILKEELNVKTVTFDLDVNVKNSLEPTNNDHDGVSSVVVKLDTIITAELKAEGLMRDIIRVVQNARKQAGLEVNDRIILSLTTTNKEIKAAIDAYQEVIATETLTTKFVLSTDGYKDTVKVDGKELSLSLTKI
ncbi:MAG: isoleucine--tRNA ligase [Candidatus Saccharimonadales bacterium]